MGFELKERLKRFKKLTAGQIFKNDSVHLAVDVFHVLQEKSNDNKRNQANIDADCVSKRNIFKKNIMKHKASGKSQLC